MSISATKEKPSCTAEATPHPMRVCCNPSGIPDDLKSIPRWVVWRWEWDADREDWSKRPTHPTTGRNCDANNPRNWMTFDDALQAFESRNNLDGLGIVFCDDDDLAGVDLDKCRDPDNGDIESGFMDVVRELNSYCELSPSGTGVKLFCRGSIAKNIRVGRIEVYHRKRFFTVTGQAVDGVPAVVRDSSAELSQLVQGLEELKRASKGTKTRKKRDANGSALTVSPERIVEKASTSQNGDQFKRLFFDGDPTACTGDGSQSSADLALCNMLAFWCGPDAGLIDQCFRQSALYRDKWERGDYRESTINAALDGRTEFYTWPKPSRAETFDRSGRQRIVTNFRTEFETDESGRNKSKKIPLDMLTLLCGVHEVTGGNIRRVGKSLFVPGSTGAVDWIESAQALFGYLGSKSDAPPQIVTGTGYHTGGEIFAELQRTAPAFRAIETIPHEPPIEGHYYACKSIEPGPETRLHDLVGRFCPETDLDRQLIVAMFATPMWGGRGGSRPTWVITADNRGRGKTSLGNALSRLYGGTVDLSPQEDIGTIKQRLLSPEALAKRVALIDNIKRLRFSWADLEALITSTSISGKRMYVGEASRPNTLTYVVTLNGVSMSTDMAQRSAIIRLGRPKHSGTWEEQTNAMIDEHRDEIYAGIVSFLRRERTPLQSYSRWGAWERSVIERFPNPDELTALILDRQGESDVEKEEAEILEDLFREKLEALSYDTSEQSVFIPSRIATDWYCEATNDKHSTTQVSRNLKQKIEAKEMSYLIVNRDNSKGRGFVWSGSDHSSPVNGDLELRIGKHKRFGGQAFS